MSNETLFYVLGIALVLSALGISFLGIRSKDFPPRQVLIGVSALFAAIVIGTVGISTRKRTNRSAFTALVIAMNTVARYPDHPPGNGCASELGERRYCRRLAPCLRGSNSAFGYRPLGI